MVREDKEFYMIKEMYQRGMSITDIAKELKMDRKSVKKYIMSEIIPTARKRKRTSNLDKFKDYINRRMPEKRVFNAEKLLLEIKLLGYQGVKTILKDYMQPYRSEQAKKKYTVRYATFRVNRCR